eukprot:gene1331-11413_t
MKIFIDFIKEGRNTTSEKQIDQNENLEDFYSNLMGISIKEETVENKSEIVKQFEDWKNEEVINHFMIPKSNIGYKMMEKCGWKETALGKNEDGRLYPIQAKTIKDVKKVTKTSKMKKEKNEEKLTKGWIKKMEKERKQKEEISRNLIFRGNIHEFRSIQYIELNDDDLEITEKNKEPTEKYQKK